MSHCTVYWARTATDRICTVARYYDQSSKADGGDIIIVHNLQSRYHTPLRYRPLVWTLILSLKLFL